MATKAWEWFPGARPLFERAHAFRMDLRQPALAILPLLMVTAGPAGVERAWGDCAPASVSVTIVTASLEGFRVYDFHSSGAALQPIIFTVSACVPDGALLSLEVRSDQGVLVRGTTQPLHLDGAVFMTNRDLAATSGTYYLADLRIESEGRSLQQIIEDTGQLPEGNYCFHVSVLQPGSTLENPVPYSGAEDERCIEVSNPTSVELIQFGGEFGPRAPIMLNAHPQFQWSSRAQAFRFVLCKALPGDASDEEVMNHRPEYEEDLSGTSGGLVSFTYPSAAEDLTRGHTYCWQVTALVATSGGQREIDSQIFCFRRWDPADIASLPMADALADLLPELARVLGVTVLGTPTGEILVDGVAVDASVVAGILEGIQSGRLEIISREME